MKKMKMKDYILDEIARILSLKTVVEISDSVEQEMGMLAVEILETKDEERKETLIKEYEQLRASNGLTKFNELEVEDVTFGFKRALDKNINEFLKK
jgi:hypothetical protein